MKRAVLTFAALAACHETEPLPPCADVERHFVQLVPAGARAEATAVIARHCPNWIQRTRRCVLDLKSLDRGMGTMPCFEDLVSDRAFRNDLTRLNERLVELR